MPSSSMMAESRSPTKFQISNRFRSAMKLNLIVGGGVRQQLSGSRGAGPRCQFLLQMRNTLAERHVEEEFHKPNQIAAVPTSVAIEQVLTDPGPWGRSSQNRAYEESVRFPRQGWWGLGYFLETQWPKQL